MIGRRWRGLAAALAVVIAGLSGCASLPQSGPVQQGDPDVAEPGSIALLARRPTPGDDAETIVDGFLRASAAGFTDDFAVAREFLAGTARASWNPLARVLVYAGQAVVEPDADDEDVLLVQAALTGTIDHAGRYTEATPGTRATVEVSLDRDAAGEWRIVGLEDGVLLSEPLFRSIFQQTPLQFVTPDGRALVPETRWYSRRTVETSAVGGLLAGPSVWLAPGVVNTFPPGTRLTVDAVAVRDGVAQVDLSAEALAATPGERALMQAQLEQTLLPLPRVRAVAVTVRGVPFEVPGPTPDLVVDPTVGTSPVVLAEGRLQSVEAGSLIPVDDAGPITSAGPSDPALPYDGSVPVVLSTGASLVTVPPEGTAPTTLLTAPRALTAPSYDRLGWVWVAQGDVGNLIHAVRVDGTRVDVAAPWLEGRQVRSLRVSREGARALVVSVSGTTVLIEVAAVVRDGEGAPLALGEPLRVGQRASSAGPAAWVDQQTVAVLGTVGSSGATTAVLVPVGGPTTALPAVDGAVEIASGKGDRLLFVATPTGELFERNGVGWTPTVRGVRDPTFPG